jgi:hypothetical protein
MYSNAMNFWQNKKPEFVESQFKHMKQKILIKKTDN